MKNLLPTLPLGNTTLKSDNNVNCTYPGCSSDCLLTKLYLVAMVTAMDISVAAPDGIPARMVIIPAYTARSLGGFTNVPSDSTYKGVGTS